MARQYPSWATEFVGCLTNAYVRPNSSDGVWAALQKGLIKAEELASDPRRIASCFDSMCSPRPVNRTLVHLRPQWEGLQLILQLRAVL